MHVCTVYMYVICKHVDVAGRLYLTRHSVGNCHACFRQPDSCVADPNSDEVNQHRVSPYVALAVAAGCALVVLLAVIYVGFFVRKASFAILIVSAINFVHIR